MSKDARRRREQLIQQYAELVRVIAARIIGHLPEWVDTEDLLSAGVLGLIKAIDRFDPSRGVKFETYATPVIRGEIMEALRAKDWVPRGVRRRAREVARAVAELEAELGRPPSAEEIAEHMGLSLEAYEAILVDTSRAALLSFEELFDESDEGQRGQQPQVQAQFSDPSLDPLAALEQEDLKRVVAEAVERLPEREQQVIALYYQEEMTLKEIGAILGVTESRVCQIHSQAMARLRAAVMREIHL